MTEFTGAEFLLSMLLIAVAAAGMVHSHVQVKRFRL